MVQRASPPTFGRLGLVYVALTVINWLQAFFFISITRGSCPKSFIVVSMVLFRLQKKTICVLSLKTFPKNIPVFLKRTNSVCEELDIFHEEYEILNSLPSCDVFLPKKELK